MKRFSTGMLFHVSHGYRGGGGYYAPTAPGIIATDHERVLAAQAINERAIHEKKIAKLKDQATALKQAGVVGVDPANFSSQMGSKDIADAVRRLDDATPDALRGQFNLPARPKPQGTAQAGQQPQQAVASPARGNATDLQSAANVAGVPLTTRDAINRAAPAPVEPNFMAPPTVTGQTSAPKPAAPAAAPRYTMEDAMRDLPVNASQNAIAAKVDLENRVASQGVAQNRIADQNTAQVASNQAQGAPGTFSGGRGQVSSVPSQTTAPMLTADQMRGVESQYAPFDASGFRGAPVTGSVSNPQPSIAPATPAGPSPSVTPPLVAGSHPSTAHNDITGNTPPLTGVPSGGLAALTEPPFTTTGGTIISNPTGAEGVTLGKPVEQGPVTSGGVTFGNPSGAIPQVSIGRQPPQPTGLAMAPDTSRPMLSGSTLAPPIPSTATLDKDDEEQKKKLQAAAPVLTSFNQ